MRASAIERRFPLPALSRVADQRLVGAFYSEFDSGRDCRAVVSRSDAGHVRVDFRYWQIGRAVPTRQGVTVALADWPAFAELVAIVDHELVRAGHVRQDHRRWHPGVARRQPGNCGDAKQVTGDGRPPARRDQEEGILHE